MEVPSFPQSEHMHSGAAAAEGQPMTVVMTDVEGSTELWEWDHETMLQVGCLGRHQTK